MGTVHACSYRYLAASVVGFVCARQCTYDVIEFSVLGNMKLLALLAMYLSSWHVCVVNLMVFFLFQFRTGMSIIGKDEKTGEIPPWSYILFAGFHLPTRLFTSISKLGDARKGIKAADEVYRDDVGGWYIGGRHGDELVSQRL